MALTHPLKRDEGFANINDTITFDALAFPYEYNVAAYVDTSKFCSVLRCDLYSVITTILGESGWRASSDVKIQLFVDREGRAKKGVSGIKQCY